MAYLAILRKADEERERRMNREQPQVGSMEPVQSGQPHWWEPGAVCWHCHGHGECRCISCATGCRLENTNGTCITCSGTGRIPQRVQ